MQIIKDNQLIDDSWVAITDEAEIGEGDVIVSCARLQENYLAFRKRSGRLAVRLLPDDNVAELGEYLQGLALIELHFPELADGRLFSHAWLLRNRYQYTGEIRATGHFLPDQVFYLSRVGVDSFAPENTEHLLATLAGLKDFTVNYQPSVK